MWIVEEEKVKMPALSVMIPLFSGTLHPSSRQASGRTRRDFFLFFFIYLAGQSVLATPLLMVPIIIFERCLDWNPDSCRSKQARFQLGHPSPFYKERFILPSTPKYIFFSCMRVGFNVDPDSHLFRTSGPGPPKRWRRNFEIFLVWKSRTLSKGPEASH